jgi:transglutaminase/protease-like cytokinesis protein 3
MGTENSTGDRCAYTMVSKADYSAVKRMLGRMDGLYRYEHYVPKNLSNYYEYLDYFAVSVQMPDDYQAAYEFIQPAIAAVSRMGTDREKVEYLNDYLCGLLAYNKKGVAGISRTFSPHSAELEAACGDYAYAFRFLCGAANIPCISISTTNHTWNMVYADGQWLHVDVAANDLYRQDYILLAKTVSDRTDQAPEATAFLKEVLIPGSTK